jgi:hypothetical protein
VLNFGEVGAREGDCGCEYSADIADFTATVVAWMKESNDSTASRGVGGLFLEKGSPEKLRDGRNILMPATDDPKGSMGFRFSDAAGVDPQTLLLSTDADGEEHERSKVVRVCAAIRLLLLRFVLLLLLLLLLPLLLPSLLIA